MKSFPQCWQWKGRGLGPGPWVSGPWGERQWARTCSSRAGPETKRRRQGTRGQRRGVCPVWESRCRSSPSCVTQRWPHMSHSSCPALRPRPRPAFPRQRCRWPSSSNWFKNWAEQRGQEMGSLPGRKARDAGITV